MTLTVGSLFSGIGGLDLGLERAGMEVIWQSEIDPYACRVLKKHWPKVVNHGNIKEINWATVERPDVICGGYPCQPFSQAGKRRGETDERHLWPWVREAISNLRPKYAILENVRGHVSMGGMSVIGNLTDLGYDAEWRLISASSVGAPHRRDRIIIVAYPAQLFRDDFTNNARSGLEREKVSQLRDGDRTPNMANANGFGRLDKQTTIFPTEGRISAFCEPSDRGWWLSEPDVGRVVNGVPARVDRLRGLGNAVVPQVAETIGRLVMSHANENQ